MKPGFYFLVASHDAGFGEQNNLVSFTDFWVSDLALVVRTRSGETKVEGFVLNAISGEPLAGAEVQAWYHTRNNVRQAGPTAKTDPNGLFSLATAANQSMLLVARHAGQMLATANDYSGRQGDLRTRPLTRTVFFTDRSLYRPGQTIHYKGICLDVDQEQDNYKTIAGRVVNVIFADGNNKEVARQQHQTNDYGSFSGSFTAPRDRVTGRMSIRIDGEPAGAAAFNVEEYKRPKFQVAVERPEVAPKLSGEVAVKGRATAYTGAAINGAKVRYRVVRQVRYPIWWGWHYWWRMPPTSGGQEITHGRAATGADGSFEIKFVAKPDLSVSEKDEPVFEYTVHADVTDTTGETRSGQQTIRVGYTALQATLAANDWQTVDKPVQLTIKTSTLDGEGQLAEGSLKIYRLKAPDKVHRQDLGGRVYPRPVFRGGDKAAPEPKPNPSDPNSWPLGEVVAEHGWTTDVEGNATFSCQLAAGATARCWKHKTGSTRRSPPSSRSAWSTRRRSNSRSRFRTRWLLRRGPSSRARSFWPCGARATTRLAQFVEIEHRRKMLKSFWTAPDITQAAVKQEVTEALRGGFTLHVTMIRENRAYTTSQKVTVPWTNKKLNVAWEHFVSKLEPAQKETWTAVITGPDAKKAVAEMVAALYDASLDAYLPHNWPQAFGVFREDYSHISSRFENMLKGLQHMRGGWPQEYQDASLSYRSFPADIIMNFWGYQFQGRNRARHSAAASAACHAARRPPRRVNAEQARRAMAMDRLANGQAEMAAAAADKPMALFAKGAADAVEKKQAGQAGADEARGTRAGLEQSLRPPEPERNRLLLPALDRRRRRPREAGIHDAGSADRVEVPRLRPRRQPAQRLLAGQSRHGQGFDGRAQSAAVPARRRCAGIHRQSLQPVAHAADGRREADAGRRSHRQADGRRVGQHGDGSEVRHSVEGIPQPVVAAELCPTVPAS